MNVVGIFAIDPGTTTGIDVGFWPTNCPVKEAVKGYEGLCDQLTGDLVVQAREICGMYAQFLGRHSGVRKHLVIESYIQRPTAHFLKGEALDPIKVAYLVIGRLSVLFEPEPVVVNWQSPSEAMAYATDARLREWNAWVKGKEHGRDARRHSLAFRNAVS